MSSPTVRGALIDGIVGIVLHLIFRSLTQNFVWLAGALMLLWVIAKLKVGPLGTANSGPALPAALTGCTPMAKRKARSLRIRLSCSNKSSPKQQSHHNNHDRAMVENIGGKHARPTIAQHRMALSSPL
jgi:hypothetical protein